jgi:hypothetical protein
MSDDRRWTFDNLRELYELRALSPHEFVFRGNNMVDENNADAILKVLLATERDELARYLDSYVEGKMFCTDHYFEPCPDSIPIARRWLQDNS